MRHDASPRLNGLARRCRPGWRHRDHDRGSTHPRIPAVGPLAVLGALGVVFGDIGTSPLYAMDAVLGETPEASRTVIYGATSTLIWLLIAVVAVLYVRLMLPNDNHGEGGLLALLTRLRRDHRTSARVRTVTTALAIVGAAAFLGDSLITPAISVLSAVEGVAVVAPGAAHLVVPLALGVLVSLFLVQRGGAQAIGRWFGPIMVVWFAFSAGFGLRAVLEHPDALTVLSPHWIVVFVLASPQTAFLSLGAVVLAVTGAEAVYADMGQFGRRAVTRAWLLAVLPALLLTYVGQAAVLVQHPETRAAYFALVPSWLVLPAVVLATAATVIASQAVISGAFTVVHQAGRLGLLPALRGTGDGPRIYLPAVNWMLLVGVIALVVGFERSSALASAYGLAVTTTITVTSILLMVRLAQTRQWARLALAAVIALIIVTVLAANVPKVATGGWLPLLVTAVLATVMYAWWTGHAAVRRATRAIEPPIGEVLTALRTRADLTRSAGTMVFIGQHAHRAPLAVGVQLADENAMPRAVVILTVQIDERPVVGAARRIVVQASGSDVGLWVVTTTIGYDEILRPRDVLAAARAIEPGLPATADAGFVVSEPRIVVASAGPVSRMRWRLYRVLDRVTAHPADLLDVPDATWFIVGRRVRVPAHPSAEVPTTSPSGADRGISGPD